MTSYSPAVDRGITASQLLLDLALIVAFRKGPRNTTIADANSARLESDLARTVNRSTHEELAESIIIRARQQELLYNAEQNIDDWQQGIGLARYERLTGKQVRVASGGSADGADAVEVLSGNKLQPKGPINIDKKTGTTHPVTDTMVQGLLKSALKAAIYKAGGSSRLIIDLMGLSEAQRKFILDELQSHAHEFKKQVFIYH